MSEKLSFALLNDYKEAVILVHGMTGAPGEMRFQAKKLAAGGYDIYCPLLAGHGAGYSQITQSSWHDWLQSIITQYDAIAGKYDKIHIAGICVGGMLGILATQSRKFATATVFSPVFEFDGWAMKRYYLLIGAAWPFLYLPFIKDIRIKEEYPFGIKNPRLRNIVINSQSDLIEGALDAMPLHSIVNMYRLGKALLKAAPNITTPVLIIHAKEDDLGKIGNAQRLEKRLGAHGNLVILEDSFHMIHVDQERNNVAALCLDFFKNPSLSKVS